MSSSKSGLTAIIAAGRSTETTEEGGQETGLPHLVAQAGADNPPPIDHLVHAEMKIEVKTIAALIERRLFYRMDGWTKDSVEVVSRLKSVKEKGKTSD